MSNVLDEAAILALLSGEEKAKKAEARERAIQVGSLKYMDKADRCVNRGCGSTTMIRINGIVRCPTHALYELNRLLIAATDPTLDDRVKNCTCNAGRHSTGNCHTSDCPTFIQIALDREEENDESGN